MKPRPITANAELLTKILNSVADGITVQDAQGNLVFVNVAAAKLLGFKTPQEVVALGPKVVTAFELFDEHGQSLAASELPGRLTFDGIKEPAKIVGYKTAGSHVHWSFVKALPVHGDNGQVELAVNIIQDITQLKATEHELREANERITRLLEQALGPDESDADYPGPSHPKLF